MRRAFVLSVARSCVCVAVLGIAVSALLAAPDLSTPKAALHEFIVSSGTGDADALKSCTYGVDDATLEDLCDAAATLRETQYAALQKYGPLHGREAPLAKTVAEATELLEKDWMRFCRFPLRIDGDHAVLTAGRSQTFEFKKVGKAWKVDATAIFVDPSPEGRRSERAFARINVRVYSQLKRDIEGNQFPDEKAEQAEQRNGCWPRCWPILNTSRRSSL